MDLLVLSLLALGAGPLVFYAARSHGRALALLEGFVVTALTGIVLLHVIPAGVEAAGGWAMAAAVAGFFVPPLVESRVQRAATTAHRAAFVLGAMGLAAHAALDGYALAVPGQTSPHNHGLAAGEALAAAVIIHRLPDGIMLWWVLRSNLGAVTAWIVFAVIALGTVAGFALPGIGVTLASPALGAFMAMMGAMLLHVVIHRERTAPLPGGLPEPVIRRYEGAAAIAALAMLVLVSVHEAPGASGLVSRGAAGFLENLLLGAPALVLAYAAAGLAHRYLPHWGLPWLRGGTPLRQAFKGMVFGIPLPLCSCAVVPLYRSFVAQGVPATAAMAFFIATPEIGFDAILLTIPLLGPEMAVARVTAAAITALTAGYLIGRMVGGKSRRGLAIAEPMPQAVPAVGWRGVLRTGFIESFDDTFPWILAGLAVAAALDPLLASTKLTLLAPWAQVPVFALLGLPMYVCASGATPVVAMLALHGLSPGAALAFLLTGPASNVTTFGLLSRLHGKAVALYFGAAVGLSATLLGWFTNLLLGPELPVPQATAPESVWHLVSWASVAVLGGALMGSLLRLGPRGFMDPVIDGLGSAPDVAHGSAGGHGHDHEHGHRHGHHANPAGVSGDSGGVLPRPAEM